VEMGPRLKLKFLYYKEDSGQQIDGEEGDVPQLLNPEMGGGNDEEEENNE